MRVRPVAAIVVFLLPGVLPAQRFPVPMPRIGGIDPRPAPLPPQPAPIARDLYYKRLRLAVESYPLVSYMETSGPGVIGQPSSWTTFGMGTRADYRLTRRLSATLDMTSSFIGGPTNTQTVELGTRFRPERTDRKFYPFLDLRVGYLSSYRSYFQPNDIYGNPTFVSSAGPRFSQGYGGVGGVGLEVALTRTFSITSAATVMRSNLTGYGYNGAFPTSGDFSMTAYRYTVGLRYNPVRLVARPPSDLPQ